MTAVADLTVNFDAEGFMTDPNEWTPEIAAVLANIVVTLHTAIA
mgnify:CR=1 FL=1